MGNGCAFLIGNMAHEGSAERDIGDLKTSADTQEREPRFKGRLRQRQFGAVPGQISHVHRIVRRSCITRRVDVATAGKHEAIDLCQPVGRLTGATGWQK